MNETAKSDAAASSLKDVLSPPGVRPQVVSDCAALVDQEVKSKSGFSGLAIKGAYGVVKAVKPGIIEETIDVLLDGFVAELEPFYQKHRANPAIRFSSTLIREPRAVADALLKFTDQKADAAKNQTIKKAYAKLRPSAVEHVQAAVPGLARLLDKYLA